MQGRVLFADFISQAKPETITSYELGVKTTGMDNRVRFNADVYTLQHAQPAAHRGGRRHQRRRAC